MDGDYATRTAPNTYDPDKVVLNCASRIRTRVILVDTLDTLHHFHGLVRLPTSIFECDIEQMYLRCNLVY